jgi:hypothetical protein
VSGGDWAVFVYVVIAARRYRRLEGLAMKRASATIAAVELEVAKPLTRPEGDWDTEERLGNREKLRKLR